MRGTAESSELGRGIERGNITESAQEPDQSPATWSRMDVDDKTPEPLSAVAHDESANAIAAQRWAVATSLVDFIATAKKNVEFWRAAERISAVGQDLVVRAGHLRHRWRLLVIVEDWCGDAVNSVPYLAKLAASVDHLELRVLPRDQNLDLMDRHLTHGKRSIPLLIALDDRGRERGVWGARPAELQQWYDAGGLELEKTERYRQARVWYARDRGRSVLHEVLSMLERADAGVQE